MHRQQHHLQQQHQQQQQQQQQHRHHGYIHIYALVYRIFGPSILGSLLEEHDDRVQQPI